MSNAEVLRITLTRIVPAGLMVGAGMETFMYFTGFWKVATKKAAERDVEMRDSRRASRAAEHARRTASLLGKEPAGSGAAAVGFAADETGGVAGAGPGAQLRPE